MSSPSTPIETVYPSPHNPRKHFDQAKLAELADSIKAIGILEPIVVRENDKGFEIVAGERRYRAAKLAELTEVPIRVMEISDEQLLELMLIENLQRDDLTPMEEGKAYRDLIDSKPTKHSAESIAGKIGKSAKYVWDRMKLLDLVPIARKLLEEGRIQLGHAILIARLKPEDQKRVIGDAKELNEDPWRRNQGLWETDHSTTLFTSDEEEAAQKKDPWWGFKACSIRELEAWIARNVRFDPEHAATAAPLLFEETAAAVKEAEQREGRGKKVVSITHEYRVPDGARDPDERTYGTNGWKRADGKEGSKTCEHSALGVVVAGPGYGEAFEVCVNKDKCRVHWKHEVDAKARRAKEAQKQTASGAATSAAGGGEKQEEKWKAEQRRYEEEQRKAQEAHKLWEKAQPAILASVAAAIEKAPIKQVIATLLDQHRDEGDLNRARKLLKPGTSAEDVVRLLVLAKLVDESDYFNAPKNFPKAAGPYGGGIPEILKRLQTSAVKEKPAKKPAKKKGKA